MTHSDKAPTADQLEMVDRLVEAHVDGEDYEGWLLNHLRQITLAAIIETQEAEAKTAEMPRWKWKGEIAAAIRSGEYLENPHD